MDLVRAARSCRGGTEAAVAFLVPIVAKRSCAPIGTRRHLAERLARRTVCVDGSGGFEALSGIQRDEGVGAAASCAAAAAALSAPATSTAV
jgi:hypothetical protein